MLYPDEHYHGPHALTQRVAHRAHVESARDARGYDAHCHLMQGYEQAASLTELQALVSRTLGMHCPLSGLGTLAEATGRESKKRLAAYLHVKPRRLTAEKVTCLRQGIIPGLQRVLQQLIETEHPPAIQHHD